MRRVMADPNPSAKMERKTQRRPAEIKPRIIERRAGGGGGAARLPRSFSFLPPSASRAAQRGGRAAGAGGGGGGGSGEPPNPGRGRVNDAPSGRRLVAAALPCV